MHLGSHQHVSLFEISPEALSSVGSFRKGEELDWAKAGFFHILRLKDNRRRG